MDDGRDRLTKRAVLPSVQRLNHPNIIKLMRVIRLPDRLAMVMEYARGGELFDHVQSKGHLPECMVRIIMCQIFRAVEYMHSQHIVHRDLKLVWGPEGMSSFADAHPLHH